MRVLLAVLVVAILPLPSAAASAAARGRIVFERSIGDQADLFFVRADGSGRVRLTTPRATESEPAWAPNARRIVAAGGPGLVELTPAGGSCAGCAFPGR